MKTISIKTVLLGVVLAAFLSETLGHSYLTNPTSRSNQKETTTGCRGPNCLGPCDRSRSASTRAPIVAARGSSISVEWPRNNHAGGFIRLAWAQTSQSDSHTAFDNGVQQINCHEVGGCKPDNVNDPNGGDTAPADGSRQPCKTTIQIPSHLTDGAWTLQWAWYGGAYELGDYYSCVDYTISGGSLSSSAAAPVFKGGDFSYPGQQKCKYFNTDRLHRCVNEPCDNPVYSGGARSGAPYMTGVTQAPVTNAPVTQAPATQAPATQTPATQAPATQTPATNAPSGGSSCTLGYMRCAGDNKYETCTNGRSGTSWVGPQSCAAGLFCNPSGNFIYCGYTKPTGTGSSATQTPATQAPATQAPSPSSSSSCTPAKLGNQQCVGTSGYKTCDQGSKWTATQSCQAGLACHQAGVNIYCY